MAGPATAPVEIALYLGIVLVLVWVGYRLYLSFSAKKEGFASSNTMTHSFTMYYADWCGHCQRAKPEFMKLGATQTIGGKTVQCSAIEAEKNPELVKEKVSGYPTIRFYDAEGNMTEYNGERN
jgi:hypothetical protein